MKIQKRFLRKYKDKDYYKYIINIPQMILKEAGLKYGEELEVKTEKNKIILERKTNKKSKFKQ
ncbi:MAG: hypothetical protein KKG94_01395 [Nanoarchaeota archaeon]|nr:hypothetical protein [Nanoarchaeota archaeon]